MRINPERLALIVIGAMIAFLFSSLWLYNHYPFWGKALGTAYIVFLVSAFIGAFITNSVRWSTGVEIARFQAHEQENEWLCEGSFVLSDAVESKSKWCRIACQIDSVSESSHRRNVTDHPYPTNDYSFELLNRDGHVIYAEGGSLREFLRFLGSRSVGSDGLFWHRFTSQREGKFALFEFIPPGPGEYTIKFRGVAEDERSAEDFSYRTQILYLELFVKQGVYPIKPRAYPHKRVVLGADRVVSSV